MTKAERKVIQLIMEQKKVEINKPIPFSFKKFELVEDKGILEKDDSDN